MADTKISGLTAASTLADTDVLPITVDMATTPVTKSTAWSLIKSTLKTYMDTLYGNVVGPASAVGDNIVTFNSTTGKLIKDSGIAILTLAASTYTPSLTNVGNIAASTAYACQYKRVGNVVTVSGQVDIDPTATAFTTLGISLPIASNLANTNECCGVASTYYSNQSSGMFLADATSNLAYLYFTAERVDNVPWSFIFQYRII